MKCKRVRTDFVTSWPG